MKDTEVKFVFPPAPRSGRVEDPELDAYYRGPLPDVFRIKDARYRVDRFGVIHQEPPFAIQQYDVGYVSERYDVIPDQVANISFLRAGFLLGHCHGIKSVLDVGYGNGGFLKVMKLAGLRCAGTDISGYPVPPGCEFLSWAQAVEDSWGLVTFFDSLEHFPDLAVLGQLRAQWVAITVPCVREDVTVDWFAGWKHRRPGEHLHHFRPSALDMWMRSLGWRNIEAKAIEDLIRRAEDRKTEDGGRNEANTMTAVYRRIE